MFFLLHNNIFAYIGAHTEFSGLPLELNNIYDQLMLFAKGGFTCTSIAISKNQVITANHCTIKPILISDTYYINHTHIMILNHSTIMNEEDLSPKRLFLSQDFTTTTSNDIDINPNILPLLYNQSTNEDISLVTVNNTKNYEDFNHFSKDKIIMSYSDYCNYFLNNCRNIKPGYHLYFFGLRSSAVKSHYFPRDNHTKIKTNIPEWVEYKTDTTNSLTVVNVFKNNSIYLTISRNAVKSESGDSGGPAFICKYDKNMLQETDCKMIAIIIGDHIDYNSIFLTPIFTLKTLAEKNIKQIPPNLFPINTCEELEINYIDYQYIYLFHNNQYARFSIRSDRYTDDKYNLLVYSNGIIYEKGLSFKECENNKLYFSQLHFPASPTYEARHKEFFYKLSGTYFYKDTSSSISYNKFYTCEEFEDFIKNQDSILFYTFYKSPQDSNLFTQAFFKYEKKDNKSYIFNIHNAMWEDTKHNMQFSGCTYSSNHVAHLLFLNENSDETLIELSSILFYK